MRLAVDSRIVTRWLSLQQQGPREIEIRRLFKRSNVKWIVLTTRQEGNLGKSSRQGRHWPFTRLGFRLRPGVEEDTFNDSLLTDWWGLRVMMPGNGPTL